MKRLLLAVTFVTTALVSGAQYTDLARALKLVTQHAVEIGLTDEDVANSIVTNTYFNKYAGTQMVYLQQSYSGLPVFNQMMVLAFRDDKVVSASGTRIASLNQKIKPSQLAPSITPEQAIRTAFTEKKIPVPATLVSKGSRNKLDYGKMGISHENVTVELMWVPFKDGKEIKLAWQVYVAPTTSSDYWLIRVDAQQNQVIDESNLTVYCNFDAAGEPHVDNCAHQSPVAIHPPMAGGSGMERSASPDNTAIVNTANYIVVPFPAESPLHPGGTPSLQTNPWNLAIGNATTLGWHNDGTIDYNITRGNNVYAQEDRDNNNSTFGLAATSTTAPSPDPLNFNFTPNFGVTPTQTSPVPNQQFNITNLFYWNNLTHDISYQYGFDELAGNFQNSNMNRGGAQGDYVIADAQDAGGTSNANFSTPVDGQRPRMQMYLWGGNPQRDGDVDNGVVVHEYGHGISNRLTGGPSTTSCLGNAEHMGEGWSDYFALMYTQDWSTATLNTGFSSPRGIATYAAGQTPAGLGIRSQRYCTNFNVNNKVYLATLPTATHDRGEIWCATLWDMTWNIINQVGVINSNIFDPANVGGNSIALRLVIEGLRLQPCSPGFITGRNAILQADQILYNGQFACAIKEAFRRRGMGALASQGSSASVTDQVPSFVGGVNLSLTQSGMVSVPEGQNIFYTNTVSSECEAVSNFILRDTLPSNVTFVSASAGYTYDNATRVVSFPVNLASAASQEYTFTVNVNPGSYFAPITILTDQVTGTTIPSTWTTTALPAANVWTVSTTASSSTPNSYYVQNLTVAADQKLELATAISLPAGTSPRLSFTHKYNTEAGWDGGVVEISTNGGSTWQDLGPYMVSNGYNTSLGAAATNALSGRNAFSGTINSFITTTVNLTAFAGQNNVKIRFRFGSDDNTAAPTAPGGWWVDDILLNVNAVVNMRSSLFNASNVRVNTSDTITLITQGNVCSNVAISTQPANQTVCPGGTATFNVNASGTSPVIQWQFSPDGIAPYTDLPGENSALLTVTGVTGAMNNYHYRAAITNSCPSNSVSNAAVLTISTAASVTSSPTSTIACAGDAATFTVSATGTNLTYQWQVSTDGGATFTNVPGGITPTLTISPVLASMNNFQYQAVVFSCGPTGVNSLPATLTLNNAQNITQQPADVNVCPNNDVTFTIAATGTNVTYQWQRSTDGGTNYTNIAGATTTTLSVTGVTLAMNNYRYRAMVSSTCTPAGAPSNAAVLNVLQPVVVTSGPSNTTGCIGENVTIPVTLTGTVINYQWQISQGGGPFTSLTDNATYSGTTTNTLTIRNVTLSMSGNQFRLLIDGMPCSGLTTEAATLTVNSRPTVAISITPNGQLVPGTVNTINTTVTPAGTYLYQWYLNGTLLPNVTTPSYTLTPDQSGDYTVIVTDPSGCKSTSNLLTATAVFNNQVFIYPNPNNGMFQVVYYSAPNTTEVRRINVFDSKGARVYAASYTVARTYEQMNVNLSSAASGIYMVELLDANGKRIATGKVRIN